MLTVGICTYRRFDRLSLCLDSLKIQSLPQDRFKILIIDNSLQPEQSAAFRDSLAGFTNLRYVITEQCGIAYARNQALRLCDTEELIFTDDDCVVPGDWVGNFAAAFERYPDPVAVIGGRVKPMWEHEPPRWLAPPLLYSLALIDWGEQDIFITHNKNWLLTANAGYRTEALRHAGGFPEHLGRKRKLPLAHEELAANKALQAMGYELVYVAALEVSHFIPAERMTQQNFCRDAFWDGVSHALYRRVGLSGQDTDALADALLPMVEGMVTSKDTGYTTEELKNRRKQLWNRGFGEANRILEARAESSSTPTLKQRVRLDMTTQPGENWHPPEENAQGEHLCWSGPGARATVSLPVTRDRAALVVVEYLECALEEQLAGLRVEADGAAIPHEVIDDGVAKFIVARLPARKHASNAATTVALLLPRTVSRGGANQRQLGLAVSSISAVPGEPSLQKSISAPPFAVWRRLVGRGREDPEDFPYSHFDGLAYFEANPDIVHLVLSGAVPSALEHYRRRGRSEGRRYVLATLREPNAGALADVFDGAAYLEAYRDVAAAIRAGTAASAMDHFVKHGSKEGRQASARLDGTACRGTPFDLAGLDAVREARAEIKRLEVKIDAAAGRFAESNRRRAAMESIVRAEIELVKHELSISLLDHAGPADTAGPAESLPRRSWSQLGQDLWVIQRAGLRKGGYFVDIGASDGVLLSNTYLLERRYGWKGICVEPDPAAFVKLKENRRAQCSHACLWSVSDEEVDFILANEYGGIAQRADLDRHAGTREAYRTLGKVIKVRTLSLNDLLAGAGAPALVDYVSLDTEGSEFEILSTFDFSRWKVAMWTIEHNFTPQRERIFELMTAHGYQRQEARWDDWYFL